ncbi:MAG: exo-beta-N-acetylmuramidase NamZ domain-containing protein [Bacteroidia bacterium]
MTLACDNTAEPAEGETIVVGEEPSVSEPIAADPQTSLHERAIKPQLMPYRSGAERLVSTDLSKLDGQAVALVANHTSLVFGETHLVDTLLGAGIKLVKVFAPEHGFRGTADAGEKIENSRDAKTGLPILSLHGNTRKPKASQLADIDIVVFDIQDVGTRFYTYISTMSLVMEACAEAGKSVMILDRANPNGWYVDGPLMGECCTSFIGMHEVPIVHGMTIGEYAQMVNNEGWLANAAKVNLEVILCEGYDHNSRWADIGRPWVAPSPNLATEYSAYLYAGICWFEPTEVSVGRGTDDAFTMLGAPWFRMPGANARLVQGDGLNLIPYNFTPRSLPGKSKYPKHQDNACTGLRFEGRTDGKSLMMSGISLLEAFYEQYQNSGESGPFFKKGFYRWPGNNGFQQQIVAGDSPEAIWQSWQADVETFKQKRKAYLLYRDFE